MAAAAEILDQVDRSGQSFDEVVVASGSGHTHAGLLFGLKALGCGARVTGVCVRRAAAAQRPRIENHCVEIAQWLGMNSPVKEQDIVLDDEFLAPGYGQTNVKMLEAMRSAARREGLILDPTYTAKAMAGFLKRAHVVNGDRGSDLLFIHTGGQPAVFGAEHKLTEFFKSTGVDEDLWNSPAQG